MSEEESIKWLEELLKDKEKYKKYHSWVGTNTFVAIDIILDLYNKQKEKIQSLESQLDFIGEQNKYINKIEKEFYKQKEKIKELKENQTIFKEMKEELKPLIKGDYISKDKIKEILDLAYKDNYEMVKLPNNDFMCVSDCANLLDYLKELVEEK